ncbi:MAG: hypothetical protein O7E57_18460 [Gammaproteobacteria bacterium]|nr:hypothetical protein [Gammaproteobacteria bacterium]
MQEAFGEDLPVWWYYKIHATRLTLQLHAQRAVQGDRPSNFGRWMYFRSVWCQNQGCVD